MYFRKSISPGLAWSYTAPWSTVSFFPDTELCMQSLIILHMDVEHFKKYTENWHKKKYHGVERESLTPVSDRTCV